MPYRRHHDISDHTWSLLEPHLPGRPGVWGGRAMDNRKFINAVFWILRTGAPWRDLPPDYGDWKNTHRRFCRWRDQSIWESLLEKLLTKPDYEWLIMDSTHIEYSTQRYMWSWMRLVCRSECLLQIVPEKITQTIINSSKK